MTTTIDPAPLSAAEVAALQAVRSDPCVSVLLATTPAAVMLDGDATRLRLLVRRASRRLAAQECPTAPALVARLEELVDAAVAGPTAHAVGLFAGGETSRLVHLPVEVEDRVVVDPTFATRDLVRALHRTPRHYVLLLSGTQARLLDGVGGVLEPVVGAGFPVLRHDTVSAFVRAVDRALSATLRLHPAPVVLVGPVPIVAALRASSRSLSRLAGVVPGNHHHEPLSVLAQRVRPVLDAYLHSRQQEALALVQEHRRRHRVVAGMQSAWLAARRENPEMLAVEDTLTYPARVSLDGDLLLPAQDVEHPDVLDDAVDELIELVLSRGGWVALVEPGALAEYEGVALTVRP